MSKQISSTPENQQDNSTSKDLPTVQKNSTIPENQDLAQEISQEELENLREEARNKYNRLLGCGG